MARRWCDAEARQVRDLVFKISLLNQAKQLESGNAATKLGKRISKLRRCVCWRCAGCAYRLLYLPSHCLSNFACSKVEQHMQLYLEWLALFNGGVASPLTQEIKQQVFEGALLRCQ